MSKRFEPGFTLIEMMITVAIMSIVLLGFTELTNFNMKAQRGVQDASDLNTFGNMLQQIMSVNTGCTANLALMGTPPGTTAIQFNTTGPYPSPLQTTQPSNPTVPIITEIDYPMLEAAPAPPGTYIPNPNNHLITFPGSYNNWTVSNIGIQVQGSPGPNQYYITLQVNFKKTPGPNGNPVSLGSPTGLRQSTALTVTTNPTGGNTVQITGCGTSSCINIAGGSWCPIPVAGIPSGTSHSYLYYEASSGLWIETPPSTLGWSWGSFTCQAGTYSYGEGAAAPIATFSCACPGESYSNNYGVGCSVGSGNNNKILAGSPYAVNYLFPVNLAAVPPTGNIVAEVPSVPHAGVFTSFTPNQDYYAPIGFYYQ